MTKEIFEAKASSILENLEQVKTKYAGRDLRPYITFEEIHDPEEKSIICNLVLRRLPHWFGIEPSIVDYVAKVQKLYFIAAKIDGYPVGFYAIEDHNEFTSEICVCGILEDYHRFGIGRELQRLTEVRLQSKGTKFLTVKTLSHSHPDPYYKRTRLFYESVGFYPLEEMKTYWDEHNPCLFMVKAL